VQAQINFAASNFATFGSAPSETNYLGPLGNIDGDGDTNEVEYNAASQDREAWLTSNGITPPLRFDLLEGGGLKLSGLEVAFRMTAKGGSGPATFQWRKGTPSGSSSVLSNTNEFLIDFAVPANDGNYFCRYTDGSVTRNTPVINLKVTQVPLFIAQQIQGGSRKVGQSITFTVLAQGGGPGPYTYTWRKDGSSFGPNANTVTLSNLSLVDAGQYSVSVTSNGGGDARTSGPVNLTVVSGLSPLNITDQPDNVVVGEGATHTFNITVIGGSGSYNYDWRRDTVSLGAPNLPSLTLSNIVPSDVGTYTCLVSDQQDAGLTALSNGADLTITEDPVIIDEQPEDATRALGQNVQFAVTVSGASGEYDYEWRKDGMPINDALNRDSVNILNIDANDAGAYTCRISDRANPVIQTFTREAILTVLPINDLSITQQPQSVTKDLGQFHNFTVQVAGGTGDYNYEWFKDGVNLEAPNLAGYTIGSIEPADIGTYQVVITDANETFLSVTSAEADLNVELESLTIIDQPVGGTRALGESITFSVTAIGGSSSYTYDWQKDNVSLGAADSPTYEIASVQSSDAGSYTCVVTDTGLSDTLTSDPAVLNVVDAPPINIDAQPSGLTGYSGQSFDLSVSVSGGTGSYNYDWQKDGATLCDCNFPTLSFASLTPGESGTYRVIVTDATFPELELSSDEVILEIADRMNFTAQPSGERIYAGETLQFSVGLEGGLAPVTFQWLKNGSPIPDAPNTPSYNIGPAFLTDEGTYTLEVTDRFETVSTFPTVIEVNLAEVPEGGETFIFSMNGSKAVPANDSFATGVGSGSLTPQPGGGVLFSILLNHGVSNPTRFGLHAGEPNVNGPLLVDFMQTGTNVNTSVLLDEEEASMVYTGLAYLNMASLGYPNGEIRSTAFPTTTFAGPHTGDLDGNNAFDLSELLRVIQLFNAEAYQCSPSTEDGYAVGDGLKDCTPHSSDYNPQDWVISLTELLRLIQYFNSPGRAYSACDSGEDGYCVGAAIP
jgi:hypothetical protein